MSKVDAQQPTSQNTEKEAADSARSVEATIENLTDSAFTFSKQDMKGGVMKEAPTADIPPQSNGSFLATSHGVATGTSGSVYYNVEGIKDKIQLIFDNPFAGSNSYDIKTPKGFEGTIGGGGGNNAAVTYTIRNS